MNLKIQFTDLGDEMQEGKGADGDAGETNEIRSGMGRLKTRGRKEWFVILACDLWKFILCFLAGVSVRNTGCHCLCLALICGVTVKYHTQTYFRFDGSLPMGYFVCLLLEVCHWRDKQCSTEEEALETQKLKMENSSVKDQLAHCAW